MQLRGNDSVKIEVIDHERPAETIIFQVKMHVTISRIKRAYAGRRNVPPESLALLDDGVRINENLSLDMLDPQFSNPDDFHTYRWTFKMVKL